MPTKKKAVVAKTPKAVAKPKPEKKVKAAKAVKTAAVTETPAKTAAKQVAKKILVAKPAKTRNYFYAFGKRKTSGASVRLLTEGQGIYTINGRTFENYFPVFTDQDKINAPFRITSTLKVFDVSVKVSGGGIHSQAEAIRHGISRALLLFDPNLRGTLKSAGFLTRDSRIKERKKYGLKRARRAPQWQKR